jgi:hypothetical protein
MTALTSALRMSTLAIASRIFENIHNEGHHIHNQLERLVSALHSHWHDRLSGEPGLN